MESELIGLLCRSSRHKKQHRRVDVVFTHSQTVSAWKRLDVWLCRSHTSLLWLSDSSRLQAISWLRSYNKKCVCFIMHWAMMSTTITPSKNFVGARCNVPLVTVKRTNYGWFIRWWDGRESQRLFFMSVTHHHGHFTYVSLYGDDRGQVSLDFWSVGDAACCCRYFSRPAACVLKMPRLGVVLKMVHEYHFHKARNECRIAAALKLL